LLGWRPEEFWAATPAELAVVVAVLARNGEAAAANTGDLARLIDQFPDR